MHSVQGHLKNNPIKQSGIFSDRGIAGTVQPVTLSITYPKFAFSVQEIAGLNKIASVFKILQIH